MTDLATQWSNLAAAASALGVLAFTGLLGLLVISTGGRARHQWPVLRHRRKPARWLVAAVTATLGTLVLELAVAISGWELGWSLLDLSQSLVAGAWILLLVRLGSQHADDSGPIPLLDIIGLLTGIAFAGILLLSLTASIFGLLGHPQTLQLRYSGQLLLGCLGVLASAVVYFQASRRQKAAFKYLCMALGITFAHDVWLYTNAVIYGSIDRELLMAWGLVMTLVAPLLALAAARTRALGISPFVSRTAILNGSAVLGAAAYVLATVFVSQLIHSGFDRWRMLALAGFVAVATIGLLVLLTSNRVRAQSRVFVSKHFFRYRYDYRAEWLRLSRTLADSEGLPDMRMRALRALSDILNCRWGQLWTRDVSGDFTSSTSWNVRGNFPSYLQRDDPLTTFLSERQWVVDLDEVARNPGLYGGLPLPPWLEASHDAWIVTPLTHLGTLIGIAVLGSPNSRHQLNWEDHDLLKTAGQQVSSYLALVNTNEQLIRARQFEAFNRLSAYVIHDLKNISAQLSLVCSNSKRFRNHPEFLDDAFSTVEAATRKVDNMVSDLRRGVRRESARRTLVSVRYVLERVVQRHAAHAPTPTIIGIEGEPLVTVVPHRFERILEHLIQNAQEATGENGVIEVSSHFTDEGVCITIADNGVGMDEEFLRTRLFKPFDSTKGNAGMGIGAYESRETVEEFGGKLDVVSCPGEGTTFRLQLPLATKITPLDRQESRKELEAWG